MQDVIFLFLRYRSLMRFSGSAYVEANMSSGPSITLVICAGLLVYLVRVLCTFRSILMTPLRICRLESAYHNSPK
jgi:hypothetical protein